MKLMRISLIFLLMFFQVIALSMAKHKPWHANWRIPRAPQRNNYDLLLKQVQLLYPAWLFSAPCSDSDATPEAPLTQESLTVKGTVQWGTYSPTVGYNGGTDYCPKGEGVPVVMEFNCSAYIIGAEKPIVASQEQCLPDTLCFNGACVEQKSCVDSDYSPDNNEMAYFIAGTVAYEGTTIPDKCLSDALLDEQICTPVDGGAIWSHVFYDCSAQNSVCDDGKCQPPAPTDTCPVAHILLPSEINTKDLDGNGVWDSCEFPQIISKDKGGVFGYGNHHSTYGDISANGRYVVYQSFATNIVDGDTVLEDIIYYDRLLQQAKLVTKDNPASGTIQSLDSRISYDGTKVVYRYRLSYGGNLNDSIFLYNTITEQKDVISVPIGLPDADGSLYQAGPVWIDAQANIAAYCALYDSTSAGSTITGMVYYNNSVGLTTHIPKSIQEVFIFCHPLAVSGDDHYIAFTSKNKGIIAGDGDEIFDLFLFNRTTESELITEIIGVTPNGNGKSECPALSYDGKYTAFRSEASNLAGIDTLGFYDVFVYDRTTKLRQRITKGLAGAESNSYSACPDISADGRFIVFGSSATNLTEDTVGFGTSIFLFDQLKNQMVLVSENYSPNHMHHAPIISADGRYILYRLMPSVSPALYQVMITVNPLWTSEIFQ